MDWEEGNVIHSITSNTERERREGEIDLSDEEEG
jgi:hypothetical protein